MPQVKRKIPSMLEVTASHDMYTRKYFSTVEFDPAEIRLHEDSWTWQMLLSYTESREVFEDQDETKVRQLKAAITFLCRFDEFRKVLDLHPKRVRQSLFRKLLVESDRLVKAGEFGGSGGPRAMGTFRTFVFEHASELELYEPITWQSMRFRPTAKIVSKPRDLISDFTDLTQDQTSSPIDALAFRDIPELKKKVLERAITDLDTVRAACIRELDIGFRIRNRAKQLQECVVSDEVMAVVRTCLKNSKAGDRTLVRNKISVAQQVIATLKIIDQDGLYLYCKGTPYYITRNEEAREFLFGEPCGFKSKDVFAIFHHALPEEIFAAFHLLQTYVGWNFSAVMRIDPTSVEFRAGFASFQGYKSKTDDDTPVAELSLKEPWVEYALKLLICNRERLIAQGHMPATAETLWCAAGRRKKQGRPSYSFTPMDRLKTLQQRNGLAKYSPEQIRSQVIFIRALSEGGLQAAKVHSGHREIGTTARYISQVIEARLSSAINFEFVQRLQKEVLYLYSNAKDSKKFTHVTLLKPIGDGASCVDPNAPPPNRNHGNGECGAQRCHSDGGCSNRRTVIDDARIEELLATRAHYSKYWQEIWTRNPQNFVKTTLPAILYTEALYRVIQDGPYGWKLITIANKVDGGRDHG